MTKQLKEKNPNPETEGKTAIPDRAYLRRRRIFSILSLAVVLALFVWITFAVGKPLLELASDPEQFRLWVDQYGVWGRFLFVGIMALQVVVAMIPGEIIEIGSGYAFGAWEGTLLCLVGAAVGSAVIFLLTRCFGVKLVVAFVSREKLNQIRFLQNEKKLNFIIFIVFFIPGTPKDLLTYFIGLTPMKLRIFLLLSSVARIPSVITSTIGGHALGMQDYTFAIVVFVATAAVSALGLLLYNRIMKKHKQEAETHE